MNVQLMNMIVSIMPSVKTRLDITTVIVPKGTREMDTLRAQVYNVNI